MQPSFRTAREDDLDRLVEVHTSAYPDPRGPDARVRNFTGNALGALSDLHVLEEGGVVMAHAFLFPLEAWFGGRAVPMAGIATVGVAPEARGRGLAGRLLAHLHGVAHARGDVVAALYPFRQGFYARHGYAAASSYRRLRLHPASIPFACDLPARAACAADRAALAACWAAAGVRRTGTLVRTERLWDARAADTRRTWLVVDGDRRLEGYVCWSLDQDEPHAATHLRVHELAAETTRAERALWGLVRAQRGQVAVVHVDVASDDPIEAALVDADRGEHGDAQLEHSLGDVAAGPMVRVLDVPAALAARGWASEGDVIVGVTGDGVAGGDLATTARSGAGATTGRWTIAARGGRATVTATRDAPHVELEATALAAVAFGGIPVAHAARLGWMAARDEASLARAAALFAMPPYFSPDPF